MTVPSWENAGAPDKICRILFLWIIAMNAVVILPIAAVIIGAYAILCLIPLPPTDRDGE